MKKILLIIVFLFTFVTCGTYKKANWEKIGTDGSMVEVFNKKVSIEEFKTICVKDTVSYELEDWLNMVFYNSKREAHEQWLYIKDTDTNKVYVLTKDTDSTFFLNIRTIIIEKEEK